MREISIDIDVHKEIEAHRENFRESENLILRRILRLDQSSKIRPNGNGKPRPSNSGAGWRDHAKGIFLPNGTQLRADYLDRRIIGEIHDGDWVIDRKRFKSPSGALIEFARTKDGRKTNLNGWNYWEVRLPTSDAWIPILQAVE